MTIWLCLKELSLNGKWQLRDEILNFNLADAGKLSESTDNWITQPVPGDIHQGLIAAGKIKEPLIGLNFFDCTWTEQRSWWFKRSFYRSQKLVKRRHCRA